MRKILTGALIGGLLFAGIPGSALAGDQHAVSNRWAGVAIGAAAAVVGGAILGALVSQPAVAAPAPVVYSPPPVMYSPPPVMYSPPPVVYSPPPVVYAPPPVVYAPGPVYVERGWDRPVYRHGWHR
jgi:hypothetical protein